jgi:hypothetical protein
LQGVCQLKTVIKARRNKYICLLILIRLPYF